MDTQQHIFETLSPTRLFFKCAIPSMMSMMFMSIYTMVDGIFVGRFIGENALVAVNLVMPLIMISFALSDMIAVGSSVQIAIKLGEKKQQEAGGILSLCTLLILIISVFIGFAAFFFAGPAVEMMGATKEVSKLALDYTRVFALFSPLIMLSFALDNYLRICGKVNYSLIVNVLMGLCNIFLDWLFMAH
ncbi:MAG: MATE family efflux transporter, partial [Anaerovorax sp.]